MIIGILGEAGSGKDTAGKLLVEHHGFYSLALADPLKAFCGWMFNWSSEQLWGPSELRNAPDVALPLVRCPHCGYFSREMGEEEGDSAPADRLLCPICHEFAPAAEWRTALSPRFALQHLGTEWARTLRPQCHIDFALARATFVQTQGITWDPLWGVLPKTVLEKRFIPEKQVGPTSVYISDCRFKNEVDAIQARGGKVFRIVRDQKADTTSSGIAHHASEMEQRQIKDSDLDGIIDNSGSILQLSATVARIAASLEKA